MSRPAQAASGPDAAGQMMPRCKRIGGDRRGQHAGDGRDGAVEGQFAERHVVAELIAGDRADRRHQRQRDRQIVVAAFLRQVGRREIDDDALAAAATGRKHEARRARARGSRRPPCRAGRR